MIKDKEEAKETIKDYYSNEAELKEAVFSNEMPDTISEIADSNVDIYYSDIYASLDSKMADNIENARDEGLIDKDTTIDKQIQAGQYYANEQLLYEAVEELKEELK